MKKRPSIAWRLALGLTLGTALLWIGASAIALSVLRAELTDSFDETLRQTALRLLPLAVHDFDEPGERNEYRVSSLDAENQFFSYYVQNAKGRPLLLSEDATPDLVFDNVPDGFSNISGRRVLAVTDRQSGFKIVLTENGQHREEAIAEAASALFWPLAALIPLIAFGIWAAVRLAMRPVEKLRSEIAERGGHNLSELSSQDHPIELAPIADEVANLLRRLRSALDAERAFAASSAHELRTPIAGALAQTQQLALELGGKSEGMRVKEVEKALRKLGQLSEKLLQLSRLDAGFARSDTENDLLPAIKLLVHDAQASQQSAERIELNIVPDADIRAPINVDAFAIALTNLIQNALKHGVSDQPIIVSVESTRIRVSNAGPVVSQDVLMRLGERFVRGETVAEGSGLGLSIVRAIMEQTGGELVLRSPAPDRGDGFEAELHW